MDWEAKAAHSAQGEKAKDLWFPTPLQLELVWVERLRGSLNGSEGK